MFAFIRRPMMSRLAAVIGIALFTGGAQYSCSNGIGTIGHGRDIDSGNGPTFTTNLVLRDSAGARTTAFTRGETITFELTVRNRTTDTVRLEDGHPPDSDFVVFDDGTDDVRWQRNEGRAFPAVVAPIVFAPGETRTFTVEWDQVLIDGRMLGVGDYEARGVIPFAAFATDPLAPSDLGSNLVAFSVR
jgi:hypothetical protein